VVVDLMMPGMDGFELAQRIKRIADLPIIVLSAVDADQTKVDALQHFAEDYVVKPFSPAELEARIQRVLRRTVPSRTQITIGDGALEIDLAGRQVLTRAGTHPLTPTEVRFMQVMLGSLDRTVPTELLLDRVWSESDGADPSYVWVTVRRLRRKLEADPDRPRYLLTERGIGYRLSSS
jgi:DNA-binding response OmpR family regulator